MGLRYTFAVLISSGVSFAALAAGPLDTSWVEIANNYAGDSIADYPVAALQNDPTLASTPARTFDLVVSTTSPVKWASADLQVTLSGSQQFYQCANGSMRDPKPATWTTQPANQYSTFLCVPTFQHLNAFPGTLLGMAQYPVESGVGTAVLSTTKIDAAWGNAPAAAPGSYTVARLTILNSFSGTITFAGRVGTANNVINPQDIYSSFGFAMRPLAVATSADATNDGKVDTRDFNVLAGHFGEMGSLPVASGNFNRDLIVNSQDFNLYAGQYGAGTGALGSVVPEPAALTVFALAPLFLKRKR